MKRVGMVLCVAALAAPVMVSSAGAQTPASKSAVKAKSPASHTVPLEPHQLSLYPNGRPERREPAYGSTRHRFDQPTPIHNTFMGPQY